MSLLMDALKKAEQAKQAAETPASEPDGDAADFPPLSIAEPLSDAAPPPPPARSEALPTPSNEPGAAPLELALEPTPALQARAEPAPPVTPTPLDEVAEAKMNRAPAPQPTPRPAAPPPRQAATPRQTAHNVFAAKTGDGASRASRLIVPAVGIIGLLALLGGGYYLYRELNPPAQFPQRNTPPTPPVMSPPPIQPTAAPEPPPQPPATEEAATAEATAPVTDRSPRPEPPPAEPTPARQGGDGIRIQHGSRGEQVDPRLARAYQALLAGDLAQAQEEYRKILRTDRTNRDALLGLAASYEKKGDAESAASLYTRLQELDPNDDDAQARLIALGGYTDPVRGESRLKILLAQHPDSDTLHFALGNLYAAQSRWPEAQQAYFHAFQKQPGNPDYLYNLAVSLDHLGQNKLARDYYRRALATANRPYNFSPEEVRERIEALEVAAPRQ